ncbi:GntR family transcriptional regulator [Vagococcus sp.]|uniref:GntR family transcriptional regulator n=1 Tax=Vagococcus sp. TaxID=1933889 RepID=UPI003F9C1524
MVNNRLPLYIKIASDLKFKINSGEWKVNEQLPTEENLCAIYDVSRITVRKAFDELVNEGYIYKKRAIGTFVANRQPERIEHKDKIRSFTQEMNDIGRAVKTLKASISVIEASPKISNFLNVPVGSKVMNLQRVFGTEGAPFVFFDTYFTWHTEFSTDDKDYYGSFYTYLGQFGIQMGLTKEYLEAVLPNDTLMRELPITENSPMLKRVRMAQHLPNDFLEYSECFYIGNEYRYYVD